MSNIEKNAEILAALNEKDMERIMYVAFGMRLKEIGSGKGDHMRTKNIEVSASSARQLV